MRTIENFKMLEPMKYYNNEADIPKRRDMIENKDNLYIATEKHDGDWGMFIHYSEGQNLIRSRSISKVTGVYGDYTAKLPHLCEEMNEWPDNTVILAEICWGEYGTNANTVGTILRCLPPKAVERQKEKKLVGKVFDVLMWDNEDFTLKPYAERVEFFENEFGYHWNGMVDQPEEKIPYYTYFSATNVYENDFAVHADEIISAGGEGLVIQRKDNPYMPGTRTAWKTLKMKQSMDSAEYRVIAALDPNKIYDGDCLNSWQYWVEDDENGVETEKRLPVGINNIKFATPVTKPYYYGWKNGITIMLPSGIETDVASGLTDEDREWLATPEAVKAIALGNVYAEVKAMSVNDLGKLRHAYVVRLRVLEDGVND